MDRGLTSECSDKRCSLFTVAATAQEPIAAIHVRKLQCVLSGPEDAWGRDGRAQPLLVSASVSLRKPFATAASTDAVADDTVHYGTLSKAIQACFAPGAYDTPTLVTALENVFGHLTGHLTSGDTFKSRMDDKPLLDRANLRSLRVTLHLPKASLLGDGVILTGMVAFAPQQDGDSANVYGSTLQLRNLRVPTLIGVNSNERLSKQVVVATVEIDKIGFRYDEYTNLESLVVEVMEESSFETLEALGAHLAKKILEFELRPHKMTVSEAGWQVKISLEKPTAVTFADAPVVEIRTGAGMSL